MPVSEEWKAERQEITDALIRHRAKVRKSKGVTWYDHHCLFHADHHRSASWQPDTGTYYCRTEDKTYLVPQVLEALLVPIPQTVRRNSIRIPSHPSPLTATIYTYLWPDGKPSHVKLRWGDGDQKQILQSDLDFSFRLPEKTYPIYGDYNLADGLHLVVVEGEKNVERISALDDDLDGISILAVTCGSVADIKKHATELCARLGELHPASITLWPDNDEPGLAAMRSVHLALNNQGLVHSLIRPAELGLPLKGDVCDFADQNQSLSALIAKANGTLESDAVEALLAKTIVTRGWMVYPDGRDLSAISEENAKAIWYDAYRSLPNSKQLQEYLARVRLKSMREPVTISPRVYTNEQVTWWRPNQGLPYRISAEGIVLDADPPGVFLLTPDDGRHVDTSVDASGTSHHLEELLQPWILSDTEIAMITGWLVCAMGSLQTPILFMKSGAGTGKTTLARFLLSVVEPMSPELRSRVLRDERHFAIGLMKYPVALIDNVSRVESEVEDTLSQLVTGYTASIRPLYSDTETAMFLRRGIIITTTNWDIYKGDLASRTIVVEPKRRQAAYADDRYMQRRYTPLIPKIRNYIMGLLAVYYRQRVQHQNNTHFRVGDLGVVFACLGYDTAILAQQESLARSNVVSSNDPWLEAMVELWREEDSISYVKTTKEVLDWMESYGCQGVPAEKSPRLARWFAEKSPFFIDYGFTVERVMTNPRGYRFVRVEPAANSRVDSADGRGDLGVAAGVVPA